MGCYVIGTASGSKHYFLEKMGVDLCIDYTKEDFVERIVKELGTKKIDVVFDSIGGKTFSKAMKQLAPGGKMVNFGAAAQIKGSKTNVLRSIGVVLGFGLFSPLSFLMNSKSLIAVNMLKIADHRPLVFNHVLKQVIKLAEEKVIVPTVGKAFPAEDIADAHYYLEHRISIGKVVVRW
jgi:NADPH2:quinone reductase